MMETNPTTLAGLVEASDCRNPLLVYINGNNRTSSPSSATAAAAESVVELEERLETMSVSQGISLVTFRFDYEDDEPRMFRALEQAQYNGDWLLVVLAAVVPESNLQEGGGGVPQLTPSYTQELFRKLARRQYATMPSEGKKTMELSRLWISVPWTEAEQSRVVSLPAIFQQISLSITPDLRKEKVDYQQQKQREEEKRRLSSSSMMRNRLSSSGNQNLAEDSDAQLAGSGKKEGQQPQQSRPGSAAKMGPLFYRQQERVKGVTPQGTSKLGVRPKTADVAAREIPAPASAKKSTSSQQQERTNNNSGGASSSSQSSEFEALAAEAVQKLYERLLRTNVSTQQGAGKLLREVQFLASTEAVTEDGKVDSLTWCNPSDLVINAVLFRSTSTGATCVVRHGLWRGLAVGIHHYSSMDYDKLLPSLKMQFNVRHPSIMSPWCVCKGEGGAQGFYVVFPLANVGPSALSFRTLVNLTAAGAVTSGGDSVEHNQEGESNFEDGVDASAALLLMRSVAAMAISVASALLSLHKDSILHRDVNIQNVYDFGNGDYRLVLTPRARHMTLGAETVSSDGIALRWSSPEALSRSTYSATDDIYGLGILMWEALTGAHKAPLAHIVSSDDAVRAIIQGAKPSRPLHCVSSFWDHIVAPCFAAAAYRPSLPHLITRLNDYLASDPMPLGGLEQQQQPVEGIPPPAAVTHGL